MARTKATSTNEAAAADTDESAPVMSAMERSRRAETITRDHVLMATAVGVVPAPGLDLLGSMAVQLAMLARLSKTYGVPYSENVAKGLVFSLLGSLGGIGVGASVAISAVKTIPVLGTAVGAVGMPVMMGAFTYAVGKVFTQHFESGGTFLDFDAASYRQYFRDMFRRGRGIAREAKADAEKDVAGEPAANEATAPTSA